MTTLSSVAAAYVAELSADSRLAGVNVSFHGGDFTLEDAKRYSAGAPALILTILGFDVELHDGSVMACTQWGAVALAKDVPGTQRRVGVVDLAEAAVQALAQTFVASSVSTLGKPCNLKAGNSYSPAADATGLAFYALTWEQEIELQEADTSVDLDTLYVDYDLAPRPHEEGLGVVPEAQDVINLQEVSLGSISGLVYAWEVNAASVTLASGLTSAVADAAGNADMVQATAVNRPLYVASGGPNDQAYLSLQDAARFMAATVAQPAGSRLAIYAVVASAAGAGDQARASEAGADRLIFGDDGAAFNTLREHTGGTESATLTSPARDTAWHVRVLRAPDTGAVLTFDDTVTVPAFGDTEANAYWDQIELGNASGGSAGSVAAVYAVHDPDSDAHAQMLARINWLYGL